MTSKRNTSRRLKSVQVAILAATCYGISAPLSKVLLEYVPPVFMASMLYIGAGIGMTIVNLFRKKQTQQKEARLTKKEAPYAIAMVALDIAAPVFFMIGLTSTTSATASLLNDFEIVATSLIALIAFKEAIGKRMWISIALITLSSIILSIKDFSELSFHLGSVFVLLACVCWGLENNFTRMLSLKDPLQIVVIKGLGSGSGTLLIALLIGEYTVNILYIAAALFLGFTAYGLSIYFYILAQRNLGAARTSVFYSFAPFIGVTLSFIVFVETPTMSFLIALIVMLVGSYFAASEKHEHNHLHMAIEHEHRHSHNDEHHAHAHTLPVEGEHSHVHLHVQMEHSHPHTPDLHHTHSHE